MKLAWAMILIRDRNGLPQCFLDGGEGTLCGEGCRGLAKGMWLCVGVDAEVDLGNSKRSCERGGGFQETCGGSGNGGT